MPRNRWLDLPVYLAARLAVAWIQALRIESCQRLARLLAWIAADVFRVRGSVVDENLRHALPHWTAAERQLAARRMWEHLVLLVCEVAHAPRKIHRTNWRRHIRCPNKRLLVEYLLDERPLLLVSGHYGNFELAGYFAGLLGFPSFTIARPLDNPYLDRYLNRFRQSKGQHILSKRGSALKMQAILRQGGTVALLGDQHAGDKGCWVEFLNRPASCHKGLALLTLTSHAPLIVAYARRSGGPLQFEVGVAGVTDPARPAEQLSGVPALTQWYNRVLEQIVLHSPEQYWWIHRRWKGTPPARAARSGPAGQARRRPAA